MTRWHEGRMLAFDLESDGTNPHTARIVQVACVDLEPADAGVATGRAWNVDRWASIVDPGDGFEMVAEAQAVHGISTAQIRAEGRPSTQVIPEIAGKLDDCWAAGGVVVGANIGGYDLTLLDAELRRLGTQLHIRGGVVDTYCLDKCDLLDKADRFRKGSRKLVDAVKHWDVRMDEAMAHDATEDALAAARIAWRMCQRYPALAQMTPQQLYTYQVEQHAKQAESLEKHIKKAKTKDGRPQEEIDAVHIPREWPLRAVEGERRAA